jgi:hypothetical protein
LDESKVGLFLAISALLGGISGLFLTWIFVAIASACLAPICTAVLIYNGVGVWAALGYGLLSITLVQAAYLLVSIVTSLLKPIRRPMEEVNGALMFAPSLIPVLKIIEAPCQQDGSPWNGTDDPGFRIRLIVLGWRKRAMSIAINRPRRVASSLPQMTVSTLDAHVARRRGAVEDGP